MKLSFLIINNLESTLIVLRIQEDKYLDKKGSAVVQFLT